jgi:hypothetical protein
LMTPIRRWRCPAACIRSPSSPRRTRCVLATGRRRSAAPPGRPPQPGLLSEEVHRHPERVCRGRTSGRPDRCRQPLHHYLRGRSLTAVSGSTSKPRTAPVCDEPVVHRLRFQPLGDGRSGRRCSPSTPG